VGGRLRPEGWHLAVQRRAAERQRHQLVSVRPRSVYPVRAGRPARSSRASGGRRESGRGRGRPGGARRCSHVRRRSAVRVLHRLPGLDRQAPGPVAGSDRYRNPQRLLRPRSWLVHLPQPPGQEGNQFEDPRPHRAMRDVTPALDHGQDRLWPGLGRGGTRGAYHPARRLRAAPHVRALVHGAPGADTGCPRSGRVRCPLFPSGTHPRARVDRPRHQPAGWSRPGGGRAGSALKHGQGCRPSSPRRGSS
jgi:hypothetical protein